MVKKQSRKLSVIIITTLIIIWSSFIPAKSTTLGQAPLYNNNVKSNAEKLMKSSRLQDKFIGTVLEGAVKNYDKYKVLPSVTIAQAALESGWGRSDKAARLNNIFGIKADNNWKGKKAKLTSKEWCFGRMRTVASYWRIYDSKEASI